MSRVEYKMTRMLSDALYKGGRVFLARNTKGGVGKSTLLAILIYLLNMLRNELSVIDTDAANPDIYKSHHERYSAYCLGLNTEDSYTALAGLIRSLEGDVMISAAAGGQELFAEYAPVLDDACLILERPVHVLWPMDLDVDSYVSLAESAEAMPHATFWPIRNLYFGKPEEFVAWNESKTAEPYFAQKRVLDLPPTPAALMRCFKTDRMSFLDVHERGHVELQSALRIWNKRVSQALAPLLHGTHAFRAS